MTLTLSRTGKQLTIELSRLEPQYPEFAFIVAVDSVPQATFGDSRVSLIAMAGGYAEKAGAFSAAITAGCCWIEVSIQLIA